MKEILYDTGLKQGIRHFLKEISFCFRRGCCCSFSETTIYIPFFALTPSCGISIRSSLYGKKIVVEMRLEYMLTQIIITLGYVTDFSDPVHTTDRHNVDCYNNRSHLRIENYTLAISQIYKFLLNVIPQLHSRSLNVVTVSPGAVSSLIHSFESPNCPKGTYMRDFLASI